MSPSLEAFLFGCCVMAGVGGCGLRIADRFRLQGPRSERLVWVWATGLAALGYLVLAVGSLGLLRKGLFAGLLIALLALGARRFIAEMKDLMTSGLDAWKRAGWVEKVLAALTFSVMFFSLSGALSPATGQDELCYHLVQPQNYVRAGSVHAVPFSVNALWPYLTHMLFTLGVLVQGAEAAKLFHWIFYVLTGAAAGVFVRRFAGGRAAWYAAVFFWVTPAAFVQSGFAYIDNALALYVFLSFYAAFAWMRSGSKGWAWLAGIAAGLAASVKLIGLFSVLPAAVLAAAAWSVLKDPKAWTAGVLRMAAGAAAAGSAWYVRSWVLTGNPVYPFYPRFFGGNGFDDPAYMDVHARGSGLTAFLALPWDVTFHPEWFGGEVTGPLFLAVVPLALLWLKPRGVAAWAAAALLAYAVPWFIVDPNIRFFFAAFAWLAVIAGLAFDAWTRSVRGPLRWAAAAALIALAGLQSFFAVHHFSDEARLVFLGGDRDSYLKENERSWAPAQAVNRSMRPEDWILSVGEVRGFYFKPRFTLAGDFERMTPDDLGRMDAAAYAGYLRSKGFTHVMLADLGTPVGRMTVTERIVADRAASAARFKGELVVRSNGRSYTVYRILPAS